MKTPRRWHGAQMACPRRRTIADAVGKKVGARTREAGAVRRVMAVQAMVMAMGRRLMGLAKAKGKARAMGIGGEKEKRRYATERGIGHGNPGKLKLAMFHCPI